MVSVCNNPSSWEVKTKRIRNTGLNLATGSLRPAYMNETLSQKGGVRFEKRFFFQDIY